MSLTENIKFAQEPNNGMISCYLNPGSHSCDNGLLFSSTYVLLARNEPGERFTWLNALAATCEIQPGLFVRYPGETIPTNYDDLLGLSCASYFGDKQLASRIHAYGNSTDWYFGSEWLGRFIHFEPIVRASCGLDLSLWSQAKICVAFIQNCFEKPDNTSGRCLLYLASQMLQNRFILVDYTWTL